MAETDNYLLNSSCTLKITNCRITSHALPQVTQKIEKQTERPASYLNIAFTGFHDEKCKFPYFACPSNWFKGIIYIYVYIISCNVYFLFEFSFDIYF